MKAIEFLRLNGFVVIILVVMFLRLNSRPTTTRFNWTPRKPAPYDPNQKHQSDPISRNEKSLNCLFNYNGHTWDAFEVLGVPAGSSRDAIETGFKRCLASGKKESESFYRAAFDALKANGF